MIRPVPRGPLADVRLAPTLVPPKSLWSVFGVGRFMATILPPMRAAVCPQMG